MSGESIQKIANPNRYIKLNVGGNSKFLKLKFSFKTKKNAWKGRLFTTSIDTLTKQDNMLRAMFSGRMETTSDTDGYTLIDRCGKHFEKILNYLRDEDCLLNDLSDNDLTVIIEKRKKTKWKKLILISK